MKHCSGYSGQLLRWGRLYAPFGRSLAIPVRRRPWGDSIRQMHIFHLFYIERVYGPVCDQHGDLINRDEIRKRDGLKFGWICENNQLPVIRYNLPEKFKTVEIVKSNASWKRKAADADKYLRQIDIWNIAGDSKWKYTFHQQPIPFIWHFFCWLYLLFSSHLSAS